MLSPSATAVTLAPLLSFFSFLYFPSAPAPAPTPSTSAPSAHLPSSLFLLVLIVGPSSPPSMAEQRQHRPHTPSCDTISLSPYFLQSSLPPLSLSSLFILTVDVHCRRGIDAALNKLRRHPGRVPPLPLPPTFVLSFTVAASFVLHHRLSRSSL